MSPTLSLTIAPQNSLIVSQKDQSRPILPFLIECYINNPSSNQLSHSPTDFNRQKRNPWELNGWAPKSQRLSQSEWRFRRFNPWGLKKTKSTDLNMEEYKNLKQKLNPLLKLLRNMYTLSHRAWSNRPELRNLHSEIQFDMKTLRNSH